MQKAVVMLLFLYFKEFW